MLMWLSEQLLFLDPGFGVLPVPHPESHFSCLLGDADLDVGGALRDSPAE